MNSKHCHRLIDYFNRSLTADESILFEKHLMDCTECKSELDELYRLTEDLPYVSEPVAIPKDMKSRIFEEIYHQDIENSIATEKVEQREAIQPKKQNARKQRFLMPTIAAALFVSLLTNGYLYYENNQYSKAENENIQSTSQVTLLSQQEDNDAIAIASLLSKNGQDSILLQTANLPKLKEGEVYQVWVIEGENLYPAGSFQTNASGQGTLEYSLDDVKGNWDTIAITVEKEPNLPSPRGEILLAGGI